MSNSDAAEHARGFAGGIADYWREQLGERLLGFYLLGSLAHGGFSTRYSDIDVALISNDGVTPTEIEAMRRHAPKLSPDLGPRLSLFWSDRSFTIGRLPAARPARLFGSCTAAHRARARLAAPAEPR